MKYSYTDLAAQRETTERDPSVQSHDHKGAVPNLFQHTMVGILQYYSRAASARTSGRDSYRERTKLPEEFWKADPANTKESASELRVLEGGRRISQLSYRRHTEETTDVHDKFER